VKEVNYRKKTSDLTLLRTFARKTSTTQIFSQFGHSQIMRYLCQKCKKIGGSLTSFSKSVVFEVSGTSVIVASDTVR